MARPHPHPTAFVPAIRPGTATIWRKLDLGGIFSLIDRMEQERRTGAKMEEEQLREKHLCLFIGS